MFIMPPALSQHPSPRSGDEVATWSHDHQHRRLFGHPDLTGVTSTDVDRLGADPPLLHVVPLQLVERGARLWFFPGARVTGLLRLGHTHVSPLLVVHHPDRSLGLDSDHPISPVLTRRIEIAPHEQ